ncbi:uncharacterized protein LOC132549314 [Ylistrum balloti]|uniref:uncharacterized protein LOC132549314 n=1 Tax=Ylistrum balloti TaxID=509963 RepID=UPI002905D606|nr:uncharacterized protein LOC132549314 [Ylistrum balloti]
MLPLRIVCIWTLICYCQEIQCTICSEAAASEKIEVIRMCRSGSLTTDRVVIDTYDTGDPDVYSCTCTATRYFTSSYLVTFDMVHRVQQNLNCNSILTVETPGKDSREFECVWPNEVYSEKRESLKITLSRKNDKSPWKFGYCFRIETDNTKWNITCLPPVKLTTTQESVTEEPSSTTAGISMEKACLPQTVEMSTEAVVVPIVVVVLIAVITTVANVILYRRRLKLEKETKNIHPVIQSSTSVVYDTIDTDRLEPPHTYTETFAGRTYVNSSAEVTTSQT